jgi:hypothetical protein
MVRERTTGWWGSPRSNIVATLPGMGPDDPWSPSWRPAPDDRRLRRILLARRGAALAGLLWLPVALVALWDSGLRPEVTVLVVVVGSAGVALLGAGLAPAAVGSLVDAAVVGIAMALGAPVAAVTSMVIAGAILDAALERIDDLPGEILRRGVLAAVAVAPLVVLAVVGWLFSVRRYAGRLGVEP